MNVQEPAVVQQVITKLLPIGHLVDRLWEKREEKRALEKQVSACEKEYAEMETLLMARMEQEAMPKTAGSRASVAASKRVVPTVKDWDTFHAFIHRHKYYHLLERRPSVTGCRELFETKGQIPGVEPFTKSTLRLVTNGESE